MHSIRIRLVLALVASSLLLTAWPAAATPSGAGTEPAGDPRPVPARPREPRVPRARSQGVALDGQSKPAAIADGSGGMIVAWEETRLGAVDIHVKSLDADGNPRGPTVAACTATGNQYSPTIVLDGTG